MDIAPLTCPQYKRRRVRFISISRASAILRIDGDLVRMDLPVLRPKQVDELVNEVLNGTQIKALKDE